MREVLRLAAILAVMGGAAHAAGDAAKGEKEFNKCKSCHSIANGDEVIVKGGKTGPNLFGVIGRQAATEPDFKYGASIMALGEGGYVWTEDDLIIYVADPTAFLKERTGDDGAKSKMTFKLKEGGDVAAYLATFASAAQ